MVTLQLTHKLRARKPGPVSLASDEIVSRLGDWHANLLMLGRWPTVLCVNDRTLLSVVLPAKEMHDFGARFRDRALFLLYRLGLSESVIGEERAALANIVFAATSNKSVLGSMHDIARHCKWRFQGGIDGDVQDTLERMIANIPFQALEFKLPVEEAAAIFGELANNALQPTLPAAR